MAFKPKQVVWAKYEDDGQWYEAKVISVAGKKVKVKYTLDGIVQNTPIEDVSDTKPSKKSSASGKKSPTRDDLDDLNTSDSSAHDSKDPDDNDETSDPDDNDDEKKEGGKKDKLSSMTRSELKQYIADNDLDIRVTRDMEDSDILAEIRDAEKTEGKDPDEDTSEKAKAPDDDDEEKKPRKDDDDDEDDGKKKRSWCAEGDDEDGAYTEKRGMFRFWIPQGKKASITFITGKAVTFREHRVKINGKWTPFTCIAALGERCPLCEAKKPSSLAKAFFIIDHSEFDSKKTGERMKDQPRLMVMPAGSYQVLKETVEEFFEGEDDWSYAGLTITAKRTSKDKSPGTGDIFVNPEKGAFKVSKELKEKFTIESCKKEVAPLDRKTLAQKVHFIEEDDE
jgi:hypothetical protein